MALKHIRSPKDSALYPIRIEEVLVREGQWVTAATPAMRLLTGNGRTLQINCAIEGTISRLMPTGTILKAPEPVISIEEDAAAEVPPIPRTKRAGAKPTASAEPPKAKPQARPTSTPNSPPRPEPKPETPPSAPDRLTGAFSRRGLSVLAVTLVIASAGFVFNRITTANEDLGTDQTTLASTPSSAQATPAPAKPVFPTAEDRSWLSAPHLDSVQYISGGSLTNGRALNLDVDRDGKVKIVGEMNGRAFVTTYDPSTKKVTGTKTTDIDPTYAFVFADFFGMGDRDLVGFTPKRNFEISTDWLPTTTLLYSAEKDHLGPQDVPYDDLHIYSSDQNGDFMVMLGYDTKVSGALEEAMGTRYHALTYIRGGQGDRLYLPEDEANSAFKYVLRYNTISVDAMKDGNAALFLLATGSYGKDFYGEYTIRRSQTGNEVDSRFEYANDWLMEEFPPHVPREFIRVPGGLGSTIGGVTLSGMTVATDDTTYAVAGVISGVDARGATYETHPGPTAFVRIADVDENYAVRMLARNDTYRDEGLRVQDIEGLSGGRFAVLLREDDNAEHPFGALVILDSRANVLARENYDGIYLESMIYSDDTLHAVGYHVRDDGTEDPLYRSYRP
ncbi:hypothetical protein [Celeribacter ethanolicus]|uniref:hypothetical protein n=1 Tax=Celeribacter ethanolicus TaxID=1758178 RepID=UPI0008311EEF|nr:hypothetical protein [Celeribacter ethanolicus]